MCNLQYSPSQWISRMCQTKLNYTLLSWTARHSKLAHICGPQVARLWPTVITSPLTCPNRLCFLFSALSIHSSSTYSGLPLPPPPIQYNHQRLSGESGSERGSSRHSGRRDSPAGGNSDRLSDRGSDRASQLHVPLQPQVSEACQMECNNLASCIWRLDLLLLVDFVIAFWMNDLMIRCGNRSIDAKRWNSQSIIGWNLISGVQLLRSYNC